jgi:hypothetical protein
MTLIYQFLKSRFFAYIAAIGSAIAMAYVMWLSSRKVQEAEVKSAGAQELAKDKVELVREHTTMDKAELKVQLQEQAKVVKEITNTQNSVTSNSDKQVLDKLASKWTRED